IPSISITAPIDGNGIVNKAEAAAGFAISGNEIGADGQTVTVQIVDGSNQVVDTYTTVAANGAWTVNVTPTQGQALTDGNYTIKADVSDANGNPAIEASQAITVDKTISSTFIIDIKAFIDGRDLLIIKNGTLQWDHLDYAAVGRHNGDGSG